MLDRGILEKTIEAVKITGQFIREQSLGRSQMEVEVKGRHNYVTFVDKTSEKLLVERLSEVLPGSGFIAEEGTASPVKDGYNWIIDPLDGTTNFIHGAPPYAISVGLMHKEDLCLGVILEITTWECFYAEKGKGAFLNGQAIKVTQNLKVSDCLFATGFPYTEYEHLPKFMKTLEHFMHHSHGLRRLGSAAADLAYVACGRYDGFFEYGLNAWDVAAGIIIVQEAGGRVGDFGGGSGFIFGREIVASNSVVYEEFQKTIESLMRS